MNFSCDINIYYILIDVVFSEKPPKEYYSFTLDLATPKELNFNVCLTIQKKIYCFRGFSDEVDYIEEGTLIQFPYPFLSLDDIE